MKMTLEKLAKLIVRNIIKEHNNLGNMAICLANDSNDRVALIDYELERNVLNTLLHNLKPTHCPTCGTSDREHPCHVSEPGSFYLYRCRDPFHGGV